MPFHEAADVASFEAAVTALWRQVDVALPRSGPVRLVGYSLGARMALAMARAEPARIASLVLVGGHMGLEDPGARHARRTADAHWQHLLRSSSTQRFLQAFRSQSVFGPPRPAPSQAAAQAALARHTLEPLRLAASLDVLGLAAMPNFWPALPMVGCPTELVVGAQDAKFLALAKRAAAQLPRARLHEVPSAGHDVLWDAPARLVQILAGRVSS